MASLSFSLLAVALLALLAGVSAGADVARPCNDSRTTSFSFSIISKRNQTGHWIAEVKLGPELTDNKHNGGWQIHVTKNTVDNNGLEPIVSIVATLTAPVPIASPGYELFPKIGYYKLHTEGKTWAQAKVACEKEGAHLAVIRCETEADLIKQLLARYPNLGGPNMVAHIGFNDQITEGQYVTIFGQPLASTGFTRWSTIGSQPDDASPGEDCGSVHRNGGLNDIACDHIAPFLCKQDLFPPSNVGSYNQHTIVVGDRMESTGGGDVTVGETSGAATGSDGGNKEGEETSGGNAKGGETVTGSEGGDKKDGATGGGDANGGGPATGSDGGDKKGEEASGGDAKEGGPATGSDDGDKKGEETSGGDAKGGGAETGSEGGDKKEGATGGGEKDKGVTEGSPKVDKTNEDPKEITPDPDRIVFEETVE